MNKSLTAIISVVLLFSAFQASQADDSSRNTLDINLSSTNGGSQTLLTWNFGGPIVDYYTTSRGLWYDVRLTATNAFSGSLTNGTYSVINGGTLTDLSTHPYRTEQIADVELSKSNSNVFSINLQWDRYELKTFDSNHRIQYTRGDDYAVIDQAYSIFNPGVYYFISSPSFCDPSLYETLTIATVPEPSTYALFGLGGIALIVAYRRKIILKSSS